MNESLKTNLNIHFQTIYKDILNQNEILTLINEVLKLYDQDPYDDQAEQRWTEEDIFLISYGDTFFQKDEKKLKVLSKFMEKFGNHTFNNLHILPFFPFSSDDGFSITNYEEVRKDLGDWTDIKSLSKKYRLMSDIVINHASIKSKYFKEFINNTEIYKNFFIALDDTQGYENVIRPRSSNLFHEIEINKKKIKLWCTFSHDQIDLNFKNPNVLLFFIKLIHFYLNNGIKVFRLDAVAFLWKEKNTNCLNLLQTHEIVKLIRTLLNAHSKDTLLITETNLPNLENLSYFGENDEANSIYNFTLPPLLLWTLVMGDSTAIRKWSMSMPPARDNTTYFNFIASHDGIGIRPTEGILTDKERSTLVNIIKDFGGEISFRKNNDNSESVYELNIALIDAFKGTFKGIDHMQVERFISAHAIMMSLEGIPAFYIHSMLGTSNDHDLVNKTKNKRSINRKSWDYEIIDSLLSDKKTKNYQIYKELKKLIDIRKKQSAFHPNAIQFTFNLGSNFFGIWRQSLDKKQSIFSITNVTNVFQYLDLSELNLIESNEWWDLISNEIILDIKSSISLKAYQTMWITNY